MNLLISVAAFDVELSLEMSLCLMELVIHSGFLAMVDLPLRPLFTHITIFHTYAHMYALFAGKAGGSGFTADPNQLKGEMYHTALKKSSQGFGFTIIGGDRTDEFLQVKNVLSDGPAAHDNKMASGEQNPCRLYTHCFATEVDKIERVFLLK